MNLQFLQVFALASAYVDDEWVRGVFYAQLCDREEFVPIFTSSSEGHAHDCVEGGLIVWIGIEEVEVVGWCVVGELEWPI
jgi:hypothetical protein